MFISKSQLVLLWLVLKCFLRLSACFPRHGVLTDGANGEGQTCRGSLILMSDSNTKTLFYTENHDKSTHDLAEEIVITRAKLDGCGCFFIFKGWNGNGESVPLSQQQTYTPRETFRVRSFRRC